MSPRILICSASVGSGHGRAASALQSALSRLRPDAYVQNVDILQLSNPIFRRIYGRGYFDLIDLSPHLVRYFYDRLDRPTGRGPTHYFRAFASRVNLGRFIGTLSAEPWDLVLTTHFLPAQIVSGLRRSGRIACPHAVVTTDFDVHRLWVHSPVERYFTATEEGRANLAAWGVAPQRIIASGIPIDPAFCSNKLADECRQRHQIQGGRPVILQLSGGAGFGPAERVHRSLLQTQTPLDIVTVAGRNASLRQRLEDIPCPPMHRRIVLGFTDRMDELMAAADVVISKPGGLTTSESLARGAAMVVIEPIPGQEERNSDYLLENGAALKVNNLASLPHKLERLLSDEGRLAHMRQAATRIGRPFAAFDIARSALGLIERHPASQRPAPTTRLSRFRRWRRGRRTVAAPA